MTAKKMIFLVDDNPTNLTIGKAALIGKYNVITIPSGQKLLNLLEKTVPDLILLDVEMPEMNGYDVIKIIKAKPETAHVPVIFLTAKTDADSELEGLSLGAIDYITKPFSPPLLEKRIEVHLLIADQKVELKNYNDNLMAMVAEKTKTVISLQGAILRTVAELVEFRDDITGGHIERTQNYLRVLAEEALRQGVYKEEILGWDLEVFLQSAQLHDVGKIVVRDVVLQKPGKLTEEEFDEMKEHAASGVQIIERISNTALKDDFLNHAKILAGTHHERWDGKGYPNGLAGLNIPLQGRLMAIADVYDALVSERPYKKAFKHEEALEIMLEGRGTQFDPLLIDVFERTADKFKSILEASAKACSIN